MNMTPGPYKDIFKMLLHFPRVKNKDDRLIAGCLLSIKVGGRAKKVIRFNPCKLNPPFM